MQYRSIAPLLFFVATMHPLLVGAVEPTFENDIRPIFRAHCFDCHGAAEDVKGGLDLRLVRFMLQGGDSGPAIFPGDSKQSYLLERIRAGEMPPGEHRVPDRQIAILERWINAGAKTARPEPESLAPGLGLTPEERSYWAFRPISRPPIPVAKNAKRIRTPVDAFLLASMEVEQLDFAADAPKQRLVRRAYLDLLGLPPTPEEVDAFIGDDQDDAWERLVEQLLSSPKYGERWGRHWLDVTGYADSEGGTERDPPRTWAYRYRDWVVRAINQDMPFDQFITWQLAGDELVPRPIAALTDQQIEMLTATGFLRMAADATVSKNDLESRNKVVADTIKIVSSSLLGLSVACAQCHDHRYDPISQLDYYRMRAIFEPALDVGNWKTPAARRVSLWTDQDRKQAEAIEKEAQANLAERNRKQTEFMDAALKKELERFDEDLRQQLEQAYRAKAEERTDAQKALLADHPSIAKLHPGVLYQYNKEASDQLKKLDQEIAKIRSRKPADNYLRAIVEPTRAELPTTRLFYRGDYRQPKQEVTPGLIEVAALNSAAARIAENTEQVPTSGRRLEYARRLTNGKHPLLARVMVNRIWRHHFGQSFVATPDEFGKLGSPPEHQELLDWLASEWMSNGWSLKQLHRLIMNSTAYRQASIASSQAQQIDSANRFYSHFPVRRLEAEAIRDSILAVSGRLDDTLFGPPIPITADSNGAIRITGEKQRRSIYLQVRRSQPIALLKSFDAPVMETNCGKRELSTVATQSLMLMNGEFILDSAKALAKRILSQQAPNSNTSKSDHPCQPEKQQDCERMRLAWRLTYSRDPTNDEVEDALRFLTDQRSVLLEREAEDADLQALTNLCQALLSSNEFLYLE